MQIDEFLEMVRRRRSIRRFKPDPVPDEYVDKILEAGRWAMSGSNGQPWEFLVVRDRETKGKIAQALGEKARGPGSLLGGRRRWSCCSARTPGRPRPACSPASSTTGG